MKSINDEVAAVARLWLGTPYRHQASTMGAGCDCLGLLRGVWRQVYGNEPLAVPAYPADPRLDPEPAALLNTARTLLRQTAGEPATGSVMLFQLNRQFPPRHCAVLSRPGWFIHAQERLGVVEAPLSPSWQRRVFATFEFSQTR